MDSPSSKLGPSTTNRSHLALAAIVLVVLTAAILVGNDIALTREPKSFPISPPALAGEWDSSFGVVNITVDDHRVSGTYNYKYQDQSVSGTVDGTINDGGKVSLEWAEANGGNGRAVWYATNDDALAGTWGFNSSHNNGGEWKLTRHVSTEKP